MIPPKVVLLIGEDSPSIKTMHQTLKEAYEVIHFEQAEEEIQYFAPSAVVVYQNGDSRSTTLQQLQQVRRLHPRTPIVLCSSADSKQAITACPRGVSACLRWPEEQGRLLTKVKQLSNWLSRVWHRLQRSAPVLSSPVQAAPAEAKAPLQVRCFGKFEINLDGKALPPVKSEIDQAILAYLLIHPEGRGLRDRMLAGFWPLNHEKSARNCLNVAISHNRAYLRGQIGESCTIDFRSNAYRLSLGMLWECDAEAFTRLRHSANLHEQNGDDEAAIQDYQKAAALYRGDFLEHISREIQWVESTRSQMQDTYLAILDRLSVLLLRHKRYAEAISAAERILGIDDCIESAHRYMMKAYTSTGRRSKAIRQYQLCREALFNTLRVEPTEETNVLYQELTDH